MRYILANVNDIDRWQTAGNNKVQVDMDTRSDASMVQFDFEGTVEVKVKVHDVKIHPLNKGIRHVQKDNIIYVTLDKTAKLSLEVNGDRLHNLHFSNIDILEHDEDGHNYQGCMAFSVSDKNLVKDVTFENIRVESIQEGQLFNMRVLDGVIFENIVIKMKKNKSCTIEDDTINHRILCRTTDYLEIEKTDWSLFALYMQYTLIVQYQQDKIIASLQNIRYIDYDDIQNNTNNPTVYSAEDVLVEKKYTSAFIKNASDKIADKTKDRFNELFAAISSILLSQTNRTGLSTL
ncbi:MAG: hypothetical protein LBU22_01505 [Dysgonamonadaceae bacterium]|jgi:hypothetical protein|nr:hypothetical protein [Dysgonamonadaceae bacterium]